MKMCWRVEIRCKPSFKEANTNARYQYWILKIPYVIYVCNYMGIREFIVGLVV